MKEWANKNDKRDLAICSRFEAVCFSAGCCSGTQRAEHMNYQQTKDVLKDVRVVIHIEQLSTFIDTFELNHKWNKYKREVFICCYLVVLREYFLSIKWHIFMLDCKSIFCASIIRATDAKRTKWKNRHKWSWNVIKLVICTGLKRNYTYGM